MISFKARAYISERKGKELSNYSAEYVRSDREKSLGIDLTLLNLLRLNIYTYILVYIFIEVNAKRTSSVLWERRRRDKNRGYKNGEQQYEVGFLKGLAGTE